MNITIEPLDGNETLIHPLGVLHQKVFGHLRPDKPLSYFIDRYQSRLNTEKIPLTLVAKSTEGELLGAASLVEHDMTINTEYSPWLSGVMVKEAYRKQKVGRQLVQTIELYASQLGFEHLYLFTFDRAHFYQYLGYESLKTDFYLGMDVVLMAKQL